MRWTTWLMSSSPDNGRVGEILFLRGNIGHHEDFHSSYRPRRISIPYESTIFIPIITTQFSIGDLDSGKLVVDDYDLRKVICEHVDAAGPIWGVIQRTCIPNRPSKKIVANLEDFRFESPIFTLKISESNPFLRSMDVPIVPGERKTLVGGYFVMLKVLPPGSYRIRFGGKGVGNFYTDSIYDICIQPKQEKPVKDFSARYIPIQVE